MSQGPVAISELGTILGVWAHPDDETFSMDGLMCLAAKAGQTVACVTATKGEAGSQDTERWPPETLADTRAAELEAALAAIGVANHHWLDYPDGGLSSVPAAEAVSRLSGIIARYQPQTVVTFPPDGITGHDDHRTVSAWTRQALEESGAPAVLYYAVNTEEDYERFLRAADQKFNIYFNIDTPVLVPAAMCDLVLELPPTAFRCKLAALKAMPSQTEALLNDDTFADLRRSLRRENFVRAARPDLPWPE